jgi:hypothetical protein
MTGERLEIERLRPFCAQRVQQPRLAAARMTDERDIAKLRGQRIERRAHRAPVCLVAAVELARLPADQVEPGRHRTRALAAAPAIDQRPPVARTVGEGGIEMPRDVARDHRRADPRRFVRRHLTVHRADDHALLVTEYGRVQRAGDVVLGELERRAHVDDLVELAGAIEGDNQVLQFGVEQGRCGSASRTGTEGGFAIISRPGVAGGVRSAWRSSRRAGDREKRARAPQRETGAARLEGGERAGQELARESIRAHDLQHAAMQRLQRADFLHRVLDLQQAAVRSAAAARQPARAWTVPDGLGAVRSCRAAERAHPARDALTTLRHEATSRHR